MKPRTAVIGVNGYGRTHYGMLSILAAEGKVELAAAVIRDPHKAEDIMEEIRDLNCRVYPSEEALYQAERGRLDLVCIPTGPARHREMVENALRSGADVLVEKPAAGCLADVEAMIHAERRSSHFVAVGFQHIYAPEVQRLKRLLCSGKLGSLRSISALGLWPRGDAYYRRNDWAGRLRDSRGAAVFDSPLNNAFAHYLNLALFWAGGDFRSFAAPAEIQAELYRVRPEIETFDNSMVRIITDSGVEITVLFSHTGSADMEPRLRLECEHGSVEWTNKGPWRVTGLSGNLLEQGIAEHPHRRMFLDVIDRISNPERFICTLENASRQIMCIENIHRHFRIRTVPERFIARAIPDGPFVLDGIETVLQHGYERNLLPSELGVPWAESADAVTVARNGLREAAGIAVRGFCRGTADVMTVRPASRRTFGFLQNISGFFAGGILTKEMLSLIIYISDKIQQKRGRPDGESQDLRHWGREFCRLCLWAVSAAAGGDGSEYCFSGCGGYRSGKKQEFLGTVRHSAFL